MKKNIEKFRRQFDTFVALIIAFLFYIQMLVIMWNIGMKFNMIQLLSPAFAALFFYCGILIRSAKMNWFIGIRTPWTMSSERVWDKTHKIGGKMFKACGLLSLLGAVLPEFAIYFILVPAILTAAYTIVYSYFEYRKEK